MMVLSENSARRPASKRRIGVLFGGCSSEYGVSLQSAAAVLRGLPADLCEPVPIGLAHANGQWYLYHGGIDRIEEDRWLDDALCTPVCPATDRTAHGLLLIGEGAGQVLRLDAALPILHGKNGEDGTVQGALALAGVPVIGCGVLASALCMDKAMAHRIAAGAGIRVAASRSLAPGCTPTEAAAAAEAIGYPLFVKPNRAGSSFGVSRVEQPASLMPAIEAAFAQDSTVLLEQAVPGFEVGCAVLDGAPPVVGAVDEIELAGGFFDYNEKYTLKTSRIHVPARIPDGKADEIRQTALRLYRLLGCSGFARVDLFLTPAGEVYFNEVNTIPGFTPHSRYPGMMRAAGMPFEKVLRRLVEMEGTL